MDDVRRYLAEIGRRGGIKSRRKLDHATARPLLDAPVAVRRQRLLEQRGLTPGEADALLGTQMSPELKRDRSDIVLDNAGSLEHLRRAAWEAWRGIRARAALDTPPSPE